MKYKIIYQTHTLETDDIEIVRELCGLSKTLKVSVDTPNEIIDPEWNKFLDELHKKSKNRQTSPINPNDNWKQTFPQDYTRMQDPLLPQVTITC